MDLYYLGERLQKKYNADFVCYEKIIIELKAVKELTDDHRAQIINYLKATKFKLGIIVNFSHYPKLQYERFVF